MSAFSRTDQSQLSNWWWTIDRTMLVYVGILVGLGLLMAYGASPAVAERLGLSSFHFAYRQTGFLAFALMVIFFVSLLNPVQIRRLGTLMFFTCFILLIITLFVGNVVNGAQRWLPLGSFTLQPSEFMKPAFIIFTAWMFAEKKRTPDFPGWRISFIALVLIVVLLILQPDFGQAVLISVVWFSQIFMAGLPLIFMGGIVSLLVIGSLFAYLFIPHVAQRIDAFLNPALHDTYQTDLALNAFKAGGVIGRGPGEGNLKKLLPDAHSDFIFAVVGEEFGLVLCILIVGLFAIIVLRGLSQLLKEADLFTFLSTAGLLIQLGLQAFFNMGVNLAILPNKGMTLPFISYGGSSMLSLAIGMGMILALTRRNSRYEAESHRPIYMKWLNKT